MKKQGVEDWKANSALNITLVDDYLNKKKIGAKAPKDYMSGFKETNPELSQTMKSHFIDDLTTFGIWDNDYELFIEKRAESVIQEIHKRLMP